MANRIEGDLVVSGHLSPGTMTVPAASVTDSSVSGSAAIARSKLALDTLKPYPVNLSDFRVWDAPATVLPGTSANDDLGLINGTFGTAPWYVGTSDLKAAGATTRYARARIRLPAEYDSAETVQLRLVAGMITTVADTSATIDVEAYKVGDDGTVGSDLCSTAAQSINSTTFAEKNFTITATSLAPGDELDVRIAITVNDEESGTAVIGAFRKCHLLCDVRG